MTGKARPATVCRYEWVGGVGWGGAAAGMLKSFSRLGTKTPYPIPDQYFSCRNFVTIMVQHKLLKPIKHFIFNFFHGTPGK